MVSRSGPTQANPRFQMAPIHIYPWPHWGAGRPPAVQSHCTQAQLVQSFTSSRQHMHCWNVTVTPTSLLSFRW